MVLSKTTSGETTSTINPNEGTTGTNSTRTPLVLKRMSKLNPAYAPPAEAENTTDTDTLVTPNPWTTVGCKPNRTTAGSAAPSLLKNAVSNATYSYQQTPQALAQGAGGGPSQVTTQMGQLSLGNCFAPNAAVFNPSNGPSASQVTNDWRYRGKTSSHSFRQALHTAVCKLSGLTKKDFRQGEVISLPYHVANTNPNVDPSDRRLALTCEGPAYSKRRMMVILWLYQDSMLCLPLYSFQGQGIQSKPGWMQTEYVSMKNATDKNFQGQGVHPPIVVRNRKRPMDASTAAHLTGGLKVSCNEGISMVGRLEEESYRALVKLWSGITKQAQGEGWRA